MRVSERYILNNYNVSRIPPNWLIENLLHSYVFRLLQNVSFSTFFTALNFLFVLKHYFCTEYFQFLKKKIENPTDTSTYITMIKYTF